MRILPLIFEIKGKEIQTQFELAWENSHWHIRAALSCMIYLKLAEYLMNGYDKLLAYQKIRDYFEGIIFKSGILCVAPTQSYKQI